MQSIKTNNASPKIPRRSVRIAKVTPYIGPTYLVADNLFPRFYLIFYRYRNRRDISDLDFLPNTILYSEESLGSLLPKIASIPSRVSSTDLFGFEVRTLLLDILVVAPSPPPKKKRRRVSLLETPEPRSSAIPPRKKAKVNK